MLKNSWVKWVDNKLNGYSLLVCVQSQISVFLLKNVLKRNYEVLALGCRIWTRFTIMRIIYNIPYESPMSPGRHKLSIYFSRPTFARARVTLTMYLSLERFQTFPTNLLQIRGQAYVWYIFVSQPWLSIKTHETSAK